MALLRNIPLFYSLVLALGLTFIAPVHAGFIIASSEVSVDNLRFSSTADLDWTDDWYAEVTAVAQDAGSASDNGFFDGLANDLGIQAIASTPRATAEARVDIVDGSNIALLPGARISASASAEISLNASGQQSTGFAIPYFDNFFTLTGGNVGDQVSVTFELDFTSSMSSTGSADAFSYTEFAGLFRLEDLAGNLLADDFFIEEQAGFGNLANLDVSDTLSITTLLTIGEEYFISFDADSLVTGDVPEPGTLILFQFAVLFLILKRRSLAKIMS